MKTPTLLALVLFFVSSTAVAQTCPALDTLPTSFSAEEQFFTLGTDMVMSSHGERLGAAIQRTLNFTTTFELQNSHGEVVATAQERFFTWGVTIDVRDCGGRLIGTLKEEVFATLFSGFENIYSILDARGRVIGTSTRQRSHSRR